MFFPEAQPTSDASGTQRRVCSLLARGYQVEHGVNTNSVSNRRVDVTTARSRGDAGRPATSLLERTGTLLRARPHARAPADRLQHRQGGRAARRLADLGAAAQNREKWRKLAARLPLAPVTVETKPISEQARKERTQTEHAQPAPGPAATTWTNPMACHLLMLGDGFVPVSE
jgi:hypothetical protein